VDVAVVGDFGALIVDEGVDDRVLDDCLGAERQVRPCSLRELLFVSGDSRKGLMVLVLRDAQ
jgi:hypothetical protein